MRSASAVAGSSSRPARPAGSPAAPAWRSVRRSLQGNADGTGSRPGGAPGCGTAPPMVASRSRGARQDARHRAQQRARIGMAGAAKDGVDRCHTRPCGRDTSPRRRRPFRAITPMSWVISISAMPLLRCRPRSSSRICAWVVTSSAVVGSSAISDVRVARRAPWRCTTRWRKPPLSSKRIGVDAPLRVRDADLAQQRDRARARASRLETSLCARIASMIWLPTV